MNWNPQKIDEILDRTEGENLEFKAARSHFHFDELVKYCTALANEGGCSIVLGVTDKRPRQVVGTSSFKQPERTCRKGLDRETNKTLLLKHIKKNNKSGSRLQELMQVLPALSKGQVQRLLRDLKDEGKIEVRGTTRAGKWHMPKPD
jgi:predicted HTH transcriptional regulator